MRFLLPAASVLFLSASIVPLAAQAVVSIPLAQLPSSIQSCITSASCVMSHTSSYDSGTASAFYISGFQTGTGGSSTGWLIRYNLVPPSGGTDINAMQTSAYDGYLWMHVQSSYTTAESAHPVTLFLDKVTPAPSSMFNQSSDLSLFMTSTDLLAGSAYRSFYDDEGGPNSTDLGSLFGEIPLPCLAAGCGVQAQLNLGQLSYQNFGSAIYMAGFNPSDTRGLIYSQSYSYLGGEFPFSATQAFYISAVPEPAPSWLLGFGVMVVLAAVRRPRT